MESNGWSYPTKIWAAGFIILLSTSSFFLKSGCKRFLTWMAFVTFQPASQALMVLVGFPFELWAGLAKVVPVLSSTKVVQNCEEPSSSSSSPPPLYIEKPLLCILSWSNPARRLVLFLLFFRPCSWLNWEFSAPLPSDSAHLLSSQ